MRPCKAETVANLAVAAKDSKDAMWTLTAVVGMSRREYRAWQRSRIRAAASQPENAAYRTMRRTFRGVMPRRDAERLAGTLA